MKRIILTFATFFALSASYAQNNPTLPVTPAPAQEVYDFDKYLKLSKTTHDFGKLPQGPTASTEFTVKNISNDVITIENVQPSCGCTVPDWTRNPIKPGENGTIKAVYNTQGRPGNFNKTLTIKTSRGTKPVFITGEVEQAPVGSVPPAENSMIKH
ncbi:MAG: DUF1573 domain-containing protein [Chitinophagaceae bacterium]|jgi:hypothetical protein|nr:DUF1573 domain-containing protein [Chitinophagaceae bacterium]